MGTGQDHLHFLFLGAQWLYLTHPTLSGASWGFKGHGKAWAREGQAGEAIEAKLWSDGGQEKGIVPLGGIV